MSRLQLTIDGSPYEEWTEGSVSRDLKDFSGSFAFTLRDGTRSIASFAYASPKQIKRVKPGQAVKIYADGQLVLDGYIEEVSPSIDAEQASLSITGKDRAGDLIDCAAAPEGPGEFRNIKLEDAAKRICEPYGLSVRCEIDTGQPFPRYAVDLSETGLSAIEKGARQRHALVTSDGVGGVVITRTGATRAPADLRLPGNVKSSTARFSHKGRHSKTIVRGQAEKAQQRRQDTVASMTAGGSPVTPDQRQKGDGSATERERLGTALTGVAEDAEITRYRPIVHLARSQPDQQSASDEADWRSRTARADGEEIAFVVAGFGVAGRLWRVNELAFVSDAFQGVERDMLISRVTYRSGDQGDDTEITVTSPEAFDKKPVGSRRTNVSKGAQGGSKGGSKASSAGGLDSTAEAL